MLAVEKAMYIPVIYLIICSVSGYFGYRLGLSSKPKKIRIKEPHHVRVVRNLPYDQDLD